MKKIIPAVILIWMANAYVAFAEPMPWGIAYNLKTKECSGFWAGDEYVEYTLSNGWKDYYPEASGNKSVIKTENGTCEFEGGIKGKEQECCKKLGFKYQENYEFNRKILKTRPELKISATNTPKESEKLGTFIVVISAISIAFASYYLIQKNKGK